MSELDAPALLRVDLNQVGMWFADPADDDFCPATPGTTGVTPFDGDNAAGEAGANVRTSSGVSGR